MSVWDKIITSTPVNRMAAIQTSSGEVGYRNFSDGRVTRWDAPPICQPKPLNAISLEGTRFGRMVVVSYYSKNPNPKKEALWLCRCACGTYEARKAAQIRRPGNDGMCGLCRYNKDVVKGEGLFFDKAHKPSHTQPPEEQNNIKHTKDNEG